MSDSAENEERMTEWKLEMNGAEGTYWVTVPAGTAVQLSGRPFVLVEPTKLSCAFETAFEMCNTSKATFSRK